MSVGSRSLLWPRLLLAGGATLLVMGGLLFALVQFLPGRSPPASPPAPLARVAPERPTPTPVRAPAPLPPAPEDGVRPPIDNGSAPPKQGAAPATLDVPQPKKAPEPKRAVPEPPPPKKKAPEAEPAPKPAPGDFQVGDTFYQEVVVGRASSYNSLAGNFQQNTRYAIVSRFEVLKKNADGSLVARQKVEGVRLANTDRALQAQLNALLQKTKGATFTVELDAKRKVVRFAGPREAIDVFAGGNPLGGQSFLLWSFLDPDAWKELAQLSFFRPQKPLKKGETWSVPMTHSWGPLGSWTGKSVFVHAGKQAALERFQYALQLAHRPPAGGGGGLPFAVGKSEFRIQTAGGTIAYDARKGRVATFEERFHVRGQVGVAALGVTTAIAMDEVQVFQVRILDRDPWKE